MTEVTLTLELFVKMLIGGGGLIVGAMLTGFKVISDIQAKRVEDRLNIISQIMRDHIEEERKIERELLTLKADLPNLYVRREDYVVGQSVINAKLDSLWQRIDTIANNQQQQENRRHAT